MSHTALILFLTTSLVLILVPEPDMIYVVTKGVAQGRKAGLISAAGVYTGICVHTTFAALGLSAVLARSAVAFSAVKYAGGVLDLPWSESVARKRSPRRSRRIYKLL